MSYQFSTSFLYAEGSTHHCSTTTVNVTSRRCASTPGIPVESALT